MVGIRYDIILWDFDGTLVDTSKGIFRSVRSAVLAVGEPEPDEKTLRKFIGPPLMFSFQHYMGMSPETAEKAVLAFRKHYEDGDLYASAVFPGILPLLKKLHAYGAKNAVATLKPEVMAVRLMEHLELSPYIDACSGSTPDEMGHKSKAQMIDTALGMLSFTEKSRAVMIGDTRFDAEGAKEAGVDFIAISYGFGITPQEARTMEHVFMAASAQELEYFLFED